MGREVESIMDEETAARPASVGASAPTGWLSVPNASKNGMVEPAASGSRRGSETIGEFGKSGDSNLVGDPGYTNSEPVYDSLLDLVRDPSTTACLSNPVPMDVCRANSVPQSDNHGSGHPGEEKGSMDVEETAPSITVKPSQRVYRTRSRSKRDDDAERAMDIEETAKQDEDAEKVRIYEIHNHINNIDENAEKVMEIDETAPSIATDSTGVTSMGTPPGDSDEDDMEVDSDEEPKISNLAHVEGAIVVLTAVRERRRAAKKAKKKSETEDKSEEKKSPPIWDSRELYYDQLVEVFASLVQSSLEYGIEVTNEAV